MLNALTTLCLSVLQAQAPIGPSYSLGDYDGDGLLDAYVVSPAGQDKLFRNLGDGSFADVTELAGLSPLHGSRDALWQDFDSDGWLDLYVSSLAGPGHLLQNAGGGVFMDVTPQAGLDLAAAGELDAFWLDYDADGQADLYVSTPGGDRFYRNLGRGRFEPVELVPPVEFAGGVAAPVGAPLADVRGRGAPAADDPQADPARPRPHAPRGALDPSVLSRALGGAAPLYTSTGSSGGVSSFLPSPSACANALRDALAGGCNLQASDTPTLGMLYPMSTALNVSASGRVGIGTTTPLKKLHVDQPSPPGDGIGVLFGPSGLHNEGNQRIAVAAWNGNAGLSLLRQGEHGFLTEVDSSGLAFKEGYLGEVGERMRIQIGTGNVGIGTTTPTAKLDVLDGAPHNVTSNTAVHLKGVGGLDATAQRALWVEASGFVSNGINYAGYFEASSGSLGFPASDVGVYASGDTGVWAVGGNKGLFAEAGPSGWAGYFVGRSHFSDGLVIDAGASTSNDLIECRNNNGILMRVNGSTQRTQVKSLEILGGSDLSEMFTISGRPGSAQATGPGMVVCIDPERLGQLIPSTREYDSTVAGVVSGAGGVSTGMVMGQEGTVASGDQPIALTGRVYVWCDASTSPIVPGDLLTTSNAVGHAMKAADGMRAHGAILGKAMSSLHEGKGLVLVLVSLQ